MEKIALDGAWSFKQKHSADPWIEGIVPGSLYSDLLNNEIIEDPFFRDNEKELKEIVRNDFIYKREFEVGEAILSEKTIQLLCNGLDTLTTIYLNGQIVAKTYNMHRSYRFSIKDYLKLGKNEIQIEFHSPIEYIEKKQKEYFLWGLDENMVMDGHAHIRKPHYMFGWDWGPQLPDMGIWKSISIEATSDPVIADVSIKQKHKKSSVEIQLTVETEKNNSSLADCHYEIQLISPDDTILLEKVAPVSEKLEICDTVLAPQFWWPNGYGEQPLYVVQVCLKRNDEVIEEKMVKFGLRTIRLCTPYHKEDDTRSFYFEINGLPIFIKGANYIPEDNLLARTTEEKTEKLIEDALAAHFNMLRIWGGGIYPDDYFYELCDEKGILVWQDFMYACTVYQLDQDFEQEIIAEAIEQIKKFRNHPSLALWCGNNEIEPAILEWMNEETSKGNYYKYKADYIKIFEYILPKLVEEYCPQISYWSCSPSSGGSFEDTSNVYKGDSHYWRVWHGQEPITSYRKKMPFVSEFGFLAFPDIETVKSYTIAEDRVYGSYIMDFHVKAEGGSNKSLQYVMNEYKYPNNLDHLIYIMQCMQGEAMKCGVEYWRQNRGVCMGALYWQLNDCYPVASWSSIDYQHRWKAAHYYAKRFYAPILVSALIESHEASIYLTNDETQKISGKVIAKLYHNTKGLLKEWTIKVDQAPLSAEKQLTFNVTEYSQDLKNVYLAYYFVEDESIVSEGISLFVPTKYFELKKAKYSWDIKEEEEYFNIKVSTDTFARHLEVSLENISAVFSDNFFDLAEGDDRIISIKKDSLKQRYSVEDLERALKFRSVVDTFSILEGES